MIVAAFVLLLIACAVSIVSGYIKDTNAKIGMCTLSLWTLITANDAFTTYRLKDIEKKLDGVLNAKVEEKKIEE